jgi:integration host factor subunit beta
MNKPEMIRAIAAEEGITQAAVGRIIGTIIRLISDALMDDGRIEIGGFGVFKIFQSAAVSRPNPQDRTKIIHTPARNTVKFSPSPALKAVVNS